MQDITEQQELAQEISDAISKPVGFGEEFDEVGDAFQIDFYISEVSLWDFLNAVFRTDPCFKTDGCASASA